MAVLKPLVERDNLPADRLKEARSHLPWRTTIAPTCCT